MIYLDHNATTPIAAEVREAMIPYFTSEWGNPSSSYRFGSKLKSVIETARGQIAELIGASVREVLFTSCASESNNAAVRAALQANPGKRHIVTSVVEHSSILNLGRAVEKDGYRVTYLPVDRDELEEGISSGILDAELNGHKTQRLANTSNFTFSGVESEALLLLLDQAGVCASSGSACLADSDEPSHVIRAMKPEMLSSRQMLRFSLGDENQRDEIQETIAAVKLAVHTLRGYDEMSHRTREFVADHSHSSPEFIA